MNYRPVLTAQECARGLLSSPVCAVLQSGDERVNYTNMGVRVANTAANYVCRENVEGRLFFILNVKTYLFITPCKSNQVTHPKQHKSFY